MASELQMLCVGHVYDNKVAYNAAVLCLFWPLTARGSGWGWVRHNARVSAVQLYMSGLYMLKHDVFCHWNRRPTA